MDRQVIPATDLPPFGSKHFAIPFNAAGKAWVRFAIWDIAGNGAFVQPVWVSILPDLLQRNPKQSISVAPSCPLSLTSEDGQLLTTCGIFQRDVLVATEHKNEESNPQQTTCWDDSAAIY